MGGIGTYVKARSESNSSVGDSTNNRVRIDADKLRARVVGEGGNLGFTQRARIDFAAKGGRINTDAIDNSGGVDLSDHEVNIKILLANLPDGQKLPDQQRDELLMEVGPEVTDLVLDHNRDQALLLSLGVGRSQRNAPYFQSLLSRMSKLGYIKRSLECLPDEEELRERARRNMGLSRPELAVCLAAVRMWIKDEVFKSELCAAPLLQRYLFGYFPQELRDRYSNGILKHPLASNIIATEVSNVLTDGLGISYIHRMCLNHSAPPDTVIKCALASELILGSQEIRRSLRRLDNPRQARTYQTLLRETSKMLRDAGAWFILDHAGHHTSLAEIVELYKNGYSTLVHHADQIFVGEDRELYFERLKAFRKLDLEEFTARSLAVFPMIILILEMLWTSRRSGKNVTEVAQTFSSVIEGLKLAAILKMENLVETTSKWENELLVHSYEEMRRSISVITWKLLDASALDQEAVQRLLHTSPSYEQLCHTVDEVIADGPNVAAISVVAKHLRAYQLPRSGVSR